MNEVLDREAAPGSFTVAARHRDVARKLRMPVFMAVSDDDATVPADASLAFFDALGGPKALVHFRAGQGVQHGTLAKSAGDTFLRWGSYYNGHFDEMTSALRSFVRSELGGGTVGRLGR